MSLYIDLYKYTILYYYIILFYSVNLFGRHGIEFFLYEMGKHARHFNRVEYQQNEKNRFEYVFIFRKVDAAHLIQRDLYR